MPPHFAITGPPVIPGYQLLEMLGSGGMGMVWKARQVQLDRLVAIKIIRPEHLAQPGAIARFQREVKAAARLLHPHIVTVFDAGQVSGNPYLVMEYVDGIDLGQLVAQRGPLPVAQACAYIRQAASGLAHAHERGLVHRDIKPSNLMVASGGRKPQGFQRQCSPSVSSLWVDTCPPFW